MIAQRYKDMLSGKSVIRQISEWSTARGTEIGYENVFDYSLGNPSVPCPEHFTKTCIDLLQTKEPVTLHGYSPTLTIPAVRKAVAESLNRRFGMDYGMEHIFMATGAAGALAHAMRCVAVPGQDIITFAPFFPEYKPYVEGAGLNLKVVPPRTKDFQIDFDAFDAMLDENTAAVLINTPNNPSGAAYSAETLTGPATKDGLLACGDTGSGRLPDEGVLVDYVARELEHEKDMQGMKVVVSAGGTREPMDPVRYLTNHSTGKMGYAVARACMLRGADVTLLTSSDLPSVPFVKMVPFATAAELFEAVKANAMDADALVMAAAVADYRPAQVAQDKIKKHDGELSIELERTDDILGWVGEHKPEQLFVCGFSMETKDLIENSTAKLHKKNMDMIVANNIKVPGAGFGVDTNVVTLITESISTALPLQSKDDVAMHIADVIVEAKRRKQKK